MRPMLKEAGLLLEFWDEAVEHDSYISNYTNIGPNSNGINRSPTEALIHILPYIKICKTWGSKYHSYINPKKFSNGQCYDKL
jgi:hypothetical protein